MQYRLFITLVLFAFFGWPASVISPLLAAGQDAAPPAAEAAPADKADADLPDAAPPAAETPAGSSDDLPSSQDQVSRRYRRFEDTLVKLNEIMRKTDPERAELLIRALGKSKEDRIAVQMSGLVELLKNAQLGEATERQDELVTQLTSLLDLLLSEDRAKELAAEKERIKNYIKELNKVIAQEKDLRAATERGESADGLAGRQQKVAERAADLGKTIDKDDEKKRADARRDKPSGDPSDEDKPDEDKPDEDKPGESKPGESKPGESKPGESKPGESKPGESKPGESKPGESKPGESKPGESKPGESKPGESNPDEQQPTPGRENIEKARQEMEKAIEKLKQPDHQKASDHQDESLRELAKAKEKFEEILRQLREEERDKLLAALEARFQRMLALQLLVLDGTVKLDKTPVAERGSRHQTRSIELSRQEEEIAVEATKTITLLKEEGTAVAFPEAVEQMRDDMLIVSRNLERTDVGELTQTIEKDIIDALQEMIEALQKEMEKKDKNKQQQQQGQQQQDQDPSLVDQLSELKMLRSLQLRVNHRTKVLGRSVQGEQAQAPEIIGQLRNLADRQARIQQATFDLATGRNK